MNHWLDWELDERELMEIANKAIFYDRPDLQFKFDASAPPLIAAPIEAFGRDVKQARSRRDESGELPPKTISPSDKGEGE
jgi:hypothetical protein